MPHSPCTFVLKDVVFLNYLLSMTMFLNTDISQGSVMTQNDQLYASNMNNTGHKASSHLICTQLAFTMSAMNRVPCQLWKSFSANTVSQHYQSDVSLHYTISTNLICYQTRHWWQFCFQQDSALVHHVEHSQTVGAWTLNFTSFNYGLQLNSRAVKPTDCKI